MDTSHRLIKSLCAAEIAQWKARSLEYSTTLHEQLALNKNRQTLLLFRIYKERVYIYSKDLIYRQEIYKDLLITRAILYRKFLSPVVSKYCSNIDATIALELSDEGFHSTTTPVFSFQRSPGQSNILLPDSDFESCEFFESDNFIDKIDYLDKSASVIFAGATTGLAPNGMPHFEKEDIAQGVIPRVRAAMYFKDKKDIDFRLTLLVQCSPEAKNILLEKGFGAGNLNFHEQFSHKFVVSMDGNGATWSRVVVFLGSNSVLLKYDSDKIMYYYRHMIPWLHYVPIHEDSDVERILKIERENPGFFKHIADEGKEFFKTYLSRDSVRLYTGEMLSAYANLFNPPPSLEKWTAENAASAYGPIAVDIGVHLRGLGFVWFDHGDAVRATRPGLAIEGLVLAPGIDIEASDLQYRVEFDDGEISRWVDAGELCGCRGGGIVVRGFAVKLRGAAAERYVCSYSGRFSDNEHVGPRRDGEFCRSEGLGPLEVLWVDLSPIGREAD